MILLDGGSEYVVGMRKKNNISKEKENDSNNDKNLMSSFFFFSTWYLKAMEVHQWVHRRSLREALLLH